MFWTTVKTTSGNQSGEIIESFAGKPTKIRTLSGSVYEKSISSDTFIWNPFAK